MRTKGGAKRSTILLVALALLVGAAVPTAVSQVTGQTYEACHRNDGEKLVRIVKAAGECGAHETHFQFGQGAAGEPGPAGPPGSIGAGVEVEDSTMRLTGDERLVLHAIDEAEGVSGYYLLMATLTFRPHRRGGGDVVGVSCRFTTTPASAPPDLNLFIGERSILNGTMIDQIFVRAPTPRIGVLCRSGVTPFRAMEFLRGRMWVKLLEADLSGA